MIKVIWVNGIINLYKPSGITSHGAVARVRRICGMKKVGHTGTLDPMAQGVLPICLGKATKAAGLLTDAKKRYQAVMELGKVTDSQDSEGTLLQENPVHVTEEELKQAAAQFQGEIQQVPPMYSAVKVGGKRLYELAREGKEIERQPRTVCIDSIEVMKFDGRRALLDIRCSKGTYVRTICHELGKVLGCGAIMTGLTRTKSGMFDLSTAVSLDELQGHADSGTLGEILISVDRLFEQYPAYQAEKKDVPRILNGALFRAHQVQPGQIYRIYSPEGEFLCLSKGTEEGTLKLEKAFYEPQQERG